MVARGWAHLGSLLSHLLLLEVLCTNLLARHFMGVVELSLRHNDPLS